METFVSENFKLHDNVLFVRHQPFVSLGKLFARATFIGVYNKACFKSVPYLLCTTSNVFAIVRQWYEKFDKFNTARSSQEMEELST